MRAPLLDGDRNPRHANTTKQEEQGKSHDNLITGHGQAEERLKLLTKRDEGHAEELRSAANHDREQHGAGRWTEHVTMNQLPAKVLLHLFLAEGQHAHVKEPQSRSNAFTRHTHDFR